MSIKIYLNDPIFAEMRGPSIDQIEPGLIPGQEHRERVIFYGQRHWYRVSHLMWSQGAMWYYLEFYDSPYHPFSMSVPFLENELIFHSAEGQRFYGVRFLTRGKETFDETPYFNRVTVQKDRYPFRYLMTRDDGVIVVMTRLGPVPFYEEELRLVEIE